MTRALVKLAVLLAGLTVAMAVCLARMWPDFTIEVQDVLGEMEP